MSRLGSAVRARSSLAMTRRVVTAASLSMFGVLLTGQQSWAAGTAIESTNDTTAAGVGPELLGIPVLTLVWAMTGVLAIAVGMTIASRGARRRAAANTAHGGQAVTVQTVANPDEGRR